MKKVIRLTEGDLHRIVKESVNMILNEYTNGFTEKLYNGLDDEYDDSEARKARKQAARDYLSDRWQRENGLSDEQVDAVGSNDAKKMHDAGLPGTFLKRLDQNDGKNMGAARGMAYNLRKRGGRISEPKTPQPPKKKGFMDKLLGK
jgi:hypothetical protein